MSGPTLISFALNKAAKKIFGKDKSKARISMPRLLDRWGDIIAPEDPAAVLPTHISWKKTGDDVNKSSTGTLHVMAPSAIAAKLMYQEKIIVERVNRQFGLPANACLSRMVVAHSRPGSLLPKPVKKGSGLLDAETASKLAAIDDPVLRERLESLARSMPADKG